MPPAGRLSATFTAALTLSLAACGSGGSSADASAGTSGGGTTASAVSVTAGGDRCDVARTTFDAPGKVTFSVRNTGNDVTEVYVYGKGSQGAFDKVVGEVEDVAPGTTRSLVVELAGGQFEVACKPGQTGNGVRTALTVAGGQPASAEAESAYDREVEVTAKDYAFSGLDGFTAKAGEKIEFKLENASTQHQDEFEVFGPDGKPVGEVGPTDPGADGEVVLTLETAGTYRYECGIADHAERGMRGTFSVTAP